MIWLFAIMFLIGAALVTNQCYMFDKLVALIEKLIVRWWIKK